MMLAGILLTATVATPLLVLVVFLVSRGHVAWRLFLPLTPVPAIAAALFVPVGSFLQWPGLLFGLTFALDLPGALLLGTAGLLWALAAVYAGAYRPRRGNDERFVTWWLITQAGSLGVFIVADLAGFYLFFTLVSLAAYWLVVEDGTSSVKQAGAVYVSFALLGEAFLLMAFVLLAAGAPDGSLLIRDAVAALSASPMRGPILCLLILGFGVKIGLVPLHVWMPPAYTAAPIPVAAVLSGAAVKAGVIGFIRFLPFDTALPGWGETLAALGLFSAFYGVAIGVTQSNPKTVLAYSSVSQMGFIATLLGAGLAAGDASVQLLAAFYALHHILVKGGLFLALGAASRRDAHALWPLLLPAGFIALGLAGLPLTGGALAKLVVKEPLDGGAIGFLATLSAAGSTLLMLHFLHCLRRDAPGRDHAAPAGVTWPWLATAFAAFAMPWALYPLAAPEGWADLLAPKTLSELSWPLLAGGLLALALQRWRSLLPSVPAGDILAAGTAAHHIARNTGAAIEAIDGDMRRWSATGVLFLVFTVILAVAIVTAYLPAN